MVLKKVLRLLLLAGILLICGNLFAQKNQSCMATVSPANQATYCSGNAVNLAANSGSNLTYQWYRDEGLIPNATSQTYAASRPGQYKVKVSSTAPASCEFSFSEITTVTEATLPATPDFTFSPTTFECSGTPVAFAVTGPLENVHYTWEFGDGSTENGAQVSHAFYSQSLAGQDFIVKLTASNTSGCSNSRSRVVTVKPGPVVKLINQNNFRNCGGGIFRLTVFDESTLADGAAVTYKIEWGDKTTSYTSETAPMGLSHSYPVGIYTLQYSIISAGGCSVTKEYNVYNISNPAISATSPGNTAGCGPLTITFPITGVSSNHPSTTYMVDFGDGSPKQLYNHNQLPASLTHTYTKSSCGNPGNPPNDAPDAFNFRIIATNNCGSTPATVGGIRVYSKSQASFKIDPDTACVGLKTKFINTTQEGLNADCNTNTTYYWDFGDGSPEIATPALSTVPTHIYKKAGEYTVTLIADNNCTPTTFTKKIVVIAPPAAKFTSALQPTTGCLDAALVTGNQSSGDLIKFQWTVIPNTGFALTHGTDLTSAEPRILFTEAGVYRLLLTTYNACKSDTASQKILIKGLPGLSLPAGQAYCGLQTIAFGVDNEKHLPVYEANFGTIRGYKWSVNGGEATFANGTTEASPFPTIRFEKPGTYEVSATVTNECGESKSANQTIVINAIPQRPLMADQQICAGTSATIALPAGDLTYRWFASATATQALATGATFTTPALTQNKTYYLETTSAEGCLGERVSVNVLVTPVIANNQITGNQTLCLGTTPTVLNGSLPTGGGDIRYSWESSTDGLTFVAASGTADEKDYSPANLLETTWFRRTVISPTCTPLRSEPVKVEIQQPISENTLAGAQTICAGTAPATITGSLPLGGNQTYVYQWEMSTDGLEFQKAPGSSTAQDYAPAALSQTTWFRRRVTAGVCTASTSDAIQVTVNPLPAAPQASPLTICANNPAALTATAATGTIEWYATATGGQPLALGNTFTTPVLTKTTTYYLQATENDCVSARTAVTVTVKPAPVATATPATLEICNSSLTRIKLSANLPGTTFTWTQTASDQISGAANGSGSEIAQQLSNSGTTPATITYIVTPVYNGCVGNPVLVQVTVNPDLYNNSITESQVICAGSQPTTLQGSTPNGGSDQYAFRWEISVTSNTGGFSTAPGDASKLNYTPGSLTQTTWFRRTVISGGCASISPAVQITVIPALTQNTLSGDQITCYGSVPAPIAGLNPTGGTGTYEFVWEMSVDGSQFNRIEGASGKDFAPAALFQTTWFRRTVISGPCTTTSKPVKVEIQQLITQNTVAEAQVICAGTVAAPLAGSLPTGGNGNYRYQWEMSTDNQTFVNATGSSQAKDYAPGILNRTTWFRRQVSGGVCTPNFSEATLITVNPAIANNAITSSAETICTGTAPQILTGSMPGGGDGQFSFRWEVSTTSATTGFMPASGPNSSADYTAGIMNQTSWFRRQVTSGGCTMASAAVRITVNEPIANNTLVTGDQVICAGSSTPELKGAAPAGGNGTYQYAWQQSTEGPVSGFQNAAGLHTQQHYQPGILSQTTWFRRVVTSAPCTEHTSTAIRVQVNEPITQNTLAGAVTICAGSQPSELTGSLPAGGSGQFIYLWESSTVSATSGFKAAAGTNTGRHYQPGTLNQTTWFRRQALSAPCNPNISAVVAVTVTPVIVNKITTQTQVICTGMKANTLIGQLPGGGNGQYQITWEHSLDNNTFETAPGNNTAFNYEPGVLNQTTWYRRQIISGACTSYSTSVLVDVNPPITKNTIDGDQDLCSTSTPDVLNGSLPAGGNGQYQYLWESSTDNLVFAPAPGINNTRHYQPGEILKTAYFRRRVSAGTCAATYSTTVRITVTPGVSNNFIGVAQRICIGTSAAPIKGSEAIGGDGVIHYRWEVSTTGSAGGFGSATGQNDGRDYEPAYLNKTSWFRRIIISGGCSSTSRAIQITVDTNIDNNLITQAQTICTQSAPAMLAGSLPTGGSAQYLYAWEMSADGIHYTAATGNHDDRNYQPGVLTQSTWFRRAVLAAPCGASESNAVLITVLPAITQNIVSQSQTICSGQAPGLLAGQKPKGGSGTYTYQWQMSLEYAGNKVFVPAPGNSTGADYAPAALTQTTLFRRVAFSAPCQEAPSNVIRIQVNPIPELPVVQPAITCQGSPATLTATGKADNFAWYASATDTKPLFLGRTFVTPAILGETTFYVESLLAGCTSARVAVKADIYQTIARAGEDVTLTKGNTTLLRATGGLTYSWSPAAGLGDTNTAHVWAKPEESTTYTVTVKTVDGCILTDEVTVTVIPKIIATNGITPNGDGSNDTWVIKNIEHYPKAQIEIFNRWGNKVYSATGYDKPWDGTLNGQPLPVAAYYYVIRLNNEEAPISGSITLIK